jgi:hypothetical protein
MSKGIILHRDELARLMELCDKFKTDQLTVEYKEGGGIGYFLNAIIPTQINGEVGDFTIEVTGVENW